MMDKGPARELRLPQPDHWSIRTKLLLLVFVALLPALLVLFFRGLSQQRQAVEQHRRAALRQVIQLSHHQEQFVHGAHQLLSALAHTPSIQARDGEATDQLLSSLLVDSPQYANLIVAQADGLTFSSALPRTGSISYSDRPYFQKALRSRDFVVGEFVISRSTHRRVLPIAMPVMDRFRRIQSVIIASQDLESLGELVSIQNLSMGADFVLLDRNGVVLHQLNSPDSPTGSLLNRKQLSQLFGAPQGTFSQVDGVGTHRLYAFQGLCLPGETQPYMVIRLGVPERAALSEIRWRWYMDLVTLGSATLMAMLVAWILGGALVRRPVHRLLSATFRIGRGEWRAASGLPTGGSELGRLASALDELGKALYTRELSRVKSEQERLDAEQEQHRLEVQVQQAQKLESLGVLAGGIAHDFNNLLTAILGNLNLAKDGAEGQPGVVRFLEKAERVAMRATDLTRQLLAYSGRGRAVIRPVDLNQLVQEISQILEIGHSKKIQLTIQASGSLPLIYGDAAQLQQVVLNLVTNAAEAIGDRDGAIALRTFTQPLSAENLKLDFPGQSMEAGRYAILEVIDTGCGMSADIQARIFEPFFTTKPSGHGLGLSAMLGILKTHRGGIQIQSQEGQGSTFRIALPCVGALDETPPAVVEVAPDRLEGTVLLVEDEVDIREATRMGLEAMGLQVHEAADGQKALRLFRQNPEAFDLVITDLAMPHMDGQELFRKLRALRSSLPVILCSGHAAEDLVQRLREEGLTAYIPKPYLVSELRTTIWRCMALQA